MPTNLVRHDQHQHDSDHISAKIYLLSVAINEYNSSNVSNLRGCVKDAERLVQQLQENYHIPTEHICTLTNEQATRANIIQQFRTHFSQLKDGDTAIFHYSGHGAQEPAHQAFIDAKIENYGGYHEMLVVHDYGQNEVYNLADKELRLLISEVQTNKSIHFLALMDCCFSGSILRSVAGEYIRRTQLGIIQERPLENYLDGYYKRQLETTGTVALPKASFTLFTASSPKEYAYEGREGGLFTTHLCRLLQQYPGTYRPDYAELHTALHHAVAADSKGKQHPYLEYSGDASPFTQFLGRQQQPPEALPELIQKEGEWVVQLGALHGIRAATWQRVSLAILQGGKQIGTARLKRVDLEHTIVEVPADIADKVSRGGNKLQLAIYTTRLPISWGILPEANAEADMLRTTLQQQGVDVQLEDVPTAAYRIEIDSTYYKLFHADELLIGIEHTENAVEAADFLTQALRSVLHWIQVDAIRPPRRSKLSPDRYQCTFSYEDNFGHGAQIEVYPHGEEASGITELVIPFSATQEYITFRIDIQNFDDYPCYCYVVHLEQGYGMKQLLENFNQSLSYKHRLYYDSGEEGIALGFTQSETQLTKDIFLCFFSRKPLVAPHRFMRDGLGEKYGKLLTLTQARGRSLRSIVRPSRLHPAPNWTMKRFEVSLVKEDKLTT